MLCITMQGVERTADFCLSMHSAQLFVFVIFYTKNCKSLQCRRTNVRVDIATATLQTLATLGYVGCFIAKHPLTGSIECIFQPQY